jgi:hypothetical protein
MRRFPLGQHAASRFDVLRKGAHHSPKRRFFASLRKDEWSGIRPGSMTTLSGGRAPAKFRLSSSHDPRGRTLQAGSHNGTDTFEGGSAGSGRAGSWPLSYAQRRLWIVHRLGLMDAAYNIAMVVRLQGELSIPALEWSFGEIIARHEILRTRYAEESGEPVQVVEPAVLVELAVDKLAGEEDLRHQAREEAASLFDLERGPVLRLRLAEAGSRDHYLFLTVHHMAADGWSMGVLVRELCELYESRLQGRAAQLPRLAMQYKEYARWQRATVAGERLERGLEYWQDRLAGMEPLRLGQEGLPGTTGEAGLAGSEHRFELSPELVQRLHLLGRREGVTLFMSLLAALTLVLRRYSGQDDVVLGTDDANRDRVAAEGLIGFFVNQLVLRLDLSGDPQARELLRRVRVTALDAYDHRETPFEKLVEALRPERHAGRHPLFQVKLVLQNAFMPELKLTNLVVSASGTPVERVKLDLLINLWPQSGGLMGRVELAAYRFDQGFVQQLIGDFAAALELLADLPLARVSELLQRLEARGKKRRAEIGDELYAANRQRLASALSRRGGAA